MLFVQSISHLNDGLKSLVEHTSQANDPLSQDWIVCPHPMMCTWIQDHLAQSRDICVQTDAFPLSKWTHLLYQIIGVDPYLIPSESRLTWAILKTADLLSSESPHLDLFQTLFGKSILQKSKVLAGARYQIAQNLARELKRGLTHHPEWIQAWQNNQEHLVGHLQPSWWPQLWRALQPQLGSYLIDPTQHLIQLLHQSPNLITDRVRCLFFYGHHRFDRMTWRIIEELAHHLPIFCYNLDPFVESSLSSPLSDLLVEYVNLYNLSTPPPKSDNNLPTYNTQYIQSTPQGFFFQEQSASPSSSSSSSLSSSPSLPSSKPQTLLQTLHSDLITPSPSSSKKTLPFDHSIQFHACHSPLRQVETLYQSLCASFRRDPTLHPRDILVLCPDIESFIPLITAIFNGENQRLGAEISRPHGNNPFADLLIQLMNLSKSRLYRYDVFQLLKHPLVAQRFQLELAEILQIESWLKRSGIRWGLDAQHRLDVGLNESDQHTWQFGLDRILMGLLVGDESQLFEDILPFSIVDGEQVLTKFFDFFVVFQDLITDLKKSHSPRQWTHLLIRSIRCLTSPKIESTWLRHELENELHQNLARSSLSHIHLKPTAVLTLLENGLGRKSQVYGGGVDHVRFYPLDQAYGVPAKVVCFLNLSQGQFPTAPPIAPLDFLAQSPSRNLIHPLKEQQTAFIFSCLASQSQLQIYYTGQHIKGDALAPCSPVLLLQEELIERYRIQMPLEEIDQADSPSLEGSEMIDALTQYHALHPFSPRNFHADAETHQATEKTLSHEPLWLESAQVWQHAQRNPQPRQPFSVQPLSSPSRAVNRVRLDVLARFLKNPSEFFLKRGVGLHLMSDEISNREREMLELDHLQNWSLRDQTLSLFMDLDKEGLNPKEQAKYVFEHVRAQGLLPIGGMGTVSFEKAFEEVCTLFDAFKNVRQSKANTQLSLGLDLPSGVPLRVEGEHLFEDQLIFMSPSRHRLKAKDKNETPLYRGKHLLQPWLYHVALCASNQPHTGTTLIGLDGQFAQFPSLDSQAASTLLDSWVQCLEEGLTRPIRFDPDLSLSYLQSRRKTEDRAALNKELSSKHSYENVCENIYVQQAFDGSSLLQDQEGLHPDFEQTAHLIFGPLEDALYQSEYQKDFTLHDHSPTL